MSDQHNRSDMIYHTPNLPRDEEPVLNPILQMIHHSPDRPRDGRAIIPPTPKKSKSVDTIDSMNSIAKNLFGDDYVPGNNPR
jgi:hypothetical protein